MESRESLPESGTTFFTYDANGNLKTGIDDRGKKAESFYDPLDRLTRTEYDDLGESAGRVESTPAVRLFYDGATAFNGRGRLSRAEDGAGSTDFRYDPMGRVSRTVRTTAGKTLTATYRYDAAGGLTRAQYAEVNPANYALIWTHDDQGRQLTFSDGGGTFFVTGFRSEFFASGGFERTDFANGSSELIDFNERLQPFFRRAFGPQGTFMFLSYDFNDIGGDNDGNLHGIFDFLDQSQSRVYGYDALNRLTDVDGLPWTITYSYDRFGNRLTALGSASTPNHVSSSLSYDLRSNRVEGWSYDPAGNLLDDGARSYRWDAAGRLLSAGGFAMMTPAA